MQTFFNWTVESSRLSGEIAKAVAQLCYRLRGNNRKGQKYGGYIRFQDNTWEEIPFTFATEELTKLDAYVLKACLEIVEPLLARFLRVGHKIRGIGLHTVEIDSNNQLEPFSREDE